MNTNLTPLQYCLLYLQLNAPGTVFVTMFAIPIDDFKEKGIFLNKDRSDTFKKYLANQLPSSLSYEEHGRTRCEKRIKNTHKLVQERSARRKKRKGDENAAALEDFMACAEFEE